MRGTRFILLASLGATKAEWEDLVEIAKVFVEWAGFTVVGSAFQSYESGKSFIFFLEESHIVVETYLEAGLIEVTLVGCKQPLNSFNEEYGFYSHLEKNTGCFIRRMKMVYP